MHHKDFRNKIKVKQNLSLFNLFMIFITHI